MNKKSMHFSVIRLARHRIRQATAQVNRHIEVIVDIAMKMIIIRNRLHHDIVRDHGSIDVNAL